MTQDIRKTAATQTWDKAGWRAYPRVQMPDYLDPAALDAVEAQLRRYPPLVFAGEARRLKAQLADVAAARRSCCRAAIAPKASSSSAPTASATPSR